MELILLDVGSGHNPHNRATHLTDYSITDNRHRAGFKAKVDKRPFIVSSVEHLPFKTKSIYYVMCTAVIEHVDDPQKAIAELKRISIHGYYSVPSFLYETFFARYWECHKWIVTQKKVIPTTKPYIFVIKRVLSFFWKRNLRINFRAKLLRITPVCFQYNIVNW